MNAKVLLAALGLFLLMSFMALAESPADADARAALAIAQARNADPFATADPAPHLPTPPCPNCQCGCTETGRCNCQDCAHPALTKPIAKADPFQKLTKGVVCPNCNGSGKVVVGPPLANCDEPQYGECPVCHGTGKTNWVAAKDRDGWQETTQGNWQFYKAGKMELWFDPVPEELRRLLPSGNLGDAYHVPNIMPEGPPAVQQQSYLQPMQQTFLGSNCST